VGLAAPGRRRAARYEGDGRGPALRRRVVGGTKQVSAPAAGATRQRSGGLAVRTGHFV
jgi:hypothetical protein